MTTSSEYDGIIIGAGHNGLIAQAYLARAGLKVISLDLAEEAGGGLSTLEAPDRPGFLYNTHSFFHRGIPDMPWFKEFELEKHGVSYLDVEPYVSILHRDGNVLQWRADFEETYRSFARLDKDDADRLRWWRDRFIPITRDILRPEAASVPLSHDRRRAMLESTEDGRCLLEVSALSPYEFVTREFRNPAIQAGLLFINGMREVDLRAKGFGHHLPSLFASAARVQTCKGGAAMLARALVRAVQAEGGEVRTRARVKRILVEDGRAVGVELDGGEKILARRFVASGLNPQLTFLELLEPAHLPEAWRRKAEDFRYNVLGPLFSLFLNLKEQPIYRASDRFPEVQKSLMVIMGIDHIDGFLELVRKHDEGQVGPMVLWGGTPTAVDPSQAPPGYHTAFMWEKTPYSLDGDPENWVARQDEHGKRMFDFWCGYAPNLRHATIDRFVQSPRDIPLKNPNMREADVLMGTLSFGQVGIDRPFPGAGGYRTILDGLYLCGSASHPGGNITGLPGYNAAQVILADQRQSNTAPSLNVGGSAS